MLGHCRIGIGIKKNFFIFFDRNFRYDKLQAFNMLRIEDGRKESKTEMTRPHMFNYFIGITLRIQIFKITPTRKI